MSPAPSLVVFDCDGVLVDSEPIALRVLERSLAEAGLALAPGEAQRRFLGRSLASVVAMLRAEDGVALDDAALALMRDRLYAAFRRDLLPIPGVAAAVDALRAAGAAVCVASSSQPERIRLSLSLVRLLDRFEPHVFSATMVAEGKPAPDLFLHAAAAMGAAPAACLVIEDSAAGVTAARRAGMRAFGFTGGGHARAPAHALALSEAGAHRLFDDMARLPALIAEDGGA